MKTTWPKVRLGEVLRQIHRPEAVDATKVYRLLGVRWYGQGLFVREEKLGAEIAAHRVYSVRSGDFVYNRLFAWKGSFAVAGPEVTGACVSSEFPCFRATATRLDPQFLFWYFRQERAWAQVLGLSTGATPTSRNRLKESAFLAMEIPLPPVVEQRQLVARVEELAAKIYAARTIRQQAAEHAEKLMASSVARLCSFSTCTSTPVSALLGTARLQNGKSVKSSDAGNGVRCLTLSAIRRGRIDVHDSKPVPLTATEAGPFLARKGDVLIVRGNGSKVLCGQAGLVMDDCDLLVFPDLLIRASLQTERVLPEFFVAMWNSPRIRLHIEEKAKTTSGIWKINHGHITSTAVLLPSLADQRRIMTEVNALQDEVERLKLLHAETASDLDALFPAVIEDAFKKGL